MLYCFAIVEHFALNHKTCFFFATTDDFPSGGNLNSEDSLEAFPDSVPKILTKPPIEEQLALHTLWPETHKLYGHGNELFSLCCNHKGTIVASSCKVRYIDFLFIFSDNIRGNDTCIALSRN